jgi:hypothetical protein
MWEKILILYPMSTAPAFYLMENICFLLRIIEKSKGDIS